MGKSQRTVSTVSLMCEQVEHYMDIALLLEDKFTRVDPISIKLLDDWIKSFDKAVSKLRGKKRENVLRLVELSLVDEEDYEAIALNLLNVLQLMSRQMTQRDIVELQLAVGLWLETYKSFKKFIKETEVLEKLLK